MTDADVRLALYRGWVDRGSPPPHAEVASTAGVDEAEVVEAYRRLAAEHAIVLAPGSDLVWMAPPLSAVATPYRATVDGRSYWGNCVWDGLGVIAMLGGTGALSATCGDCGEPLEVEVRDRVPSHPDGYVAHFAVPASRWWDDIGFT
jgi:hypothetical protein